MKTVLFPDIFYHLDGVPQFFCVPKRAGNILSLFVYLLKVSMLWSLEAHALHRTLISEYHLWLIAMVDFDLQVHLLQQQFGEMLETEVSCSPAYDFIQFTVKVRNFSKDNTLWKCQNEWAAPNDPASMQHLNSKTLHCLMCSQCSCPYMNIM